MTAFNHQVIVYDRSGSAVADISDDLRGRKLVFRVNDWDTYQFNMATVAPNAGALQPLSRFVRVWRYPVGSSPSGDPDFCGWLGRPTKRAAARNMAWTAYSPFWRLASRWHFDIHDLTDPDATGAPVQVNPDGPFPEADVMWRMIGFTAETLPGAGADYMGMVEGSLVSAISEFPVRYDRGQNTWELVQDIVQRADCCDLDPAYIGSGADLMTFNTTLVKGSQTSFKMEFGTGLDNLEDMTEEIITDPEAVANYVVVQGQGDAKEDRSIAWADGVTRPRPISGEDFNTDDTLSALGQYMLWRKVENLPGGVVGDPSRLAHAQMLLAKGQRPPEILTPVFPRGSDCGFGTSWGVGDGVQLSCDAGAGMQFSNAWRRVVEVELDLDDLGGEQCKPSCIEDYDKLVTP